MDGIIAERQKNNSNILVHPESVFSKFSSLTVVWSAQNGIYESFLEM